MTYLVVGLILFLGMHSVSVVSEAWRDQALARFGAWRWKGFHGLISLIGLVLIVVGYGQARLEPVVLYVPPAELKPVALLLLLLVFPLFLSTHLPGRILSLAKHPTLLATKLWALAHLLVNGTLADVLLFAGFLAWAVAQRISMRWRAQRSFPGVSPSKFNDVAAVALGVVLYVVFLLWVHGWLIGVEPIAR